MTMGVDPLGKRALFWMPVDAEAEDAVDDPGDVVVTHDHVRHTRPAGRHALFSDATPADEDDRQAAVVTADDPAHDHGPVTVACSRCGAVRRVGLIEFVSLHLPIAVWLPGRTFDRWMSCPVCHKRAWMSVTLTR